METIGLTVHGMLCDFAEVSGGKLFVSGAGINLVGCNTPEAPHPVNISLALLVRIPWTKTNQQHKLRVELISEGTDGNQQRVPINQILPPDTAESELGTIIALFNAGRSPNMQVGEETLLPIAIPFPGLPLPEIGSYFFSISIDGNEEDRISFRLAPVLNMPGRQF